MTEGLAIEIAVAKMRELGIRRNYLIRYRTFLLPPLGSMELKNPTDVFILIRPTSDTRVDSESGIYDEADTGVNELQYVFTGRIVMSNLNTLQRIQVRFLQVIPQAK